MIDGPSPVSVRRILLHSFSWEQFRRRQYSTKRTIYSNEITRLASVSASNLGCSAPNRKRIELDAIIDQNYPPTCFPPVKLQPSNFSHRTSALPSSNKACYLSKIAKAENIDIATRSRWTIIIAQSISTSSQLCLLCYESSRKPTISRCLWHSLQRQPHFLDSELHNWRARPIQVTLIGQSCIISRRQGCRFQLATLLSRAPLLA